MTDDIAQTPADQPATLPAADATAPTVSRPVPGSLIAEGRIGARSVTGPEGITEDTIVDYPGFGEVRVREAARLGLIDQAADGYRFAGSPVPTGTTRATEDDNHAEAVLDSFVSGGAGNWPYESARQATNAYLALHSAGKVMGDVYTGDDGAKTYLVSTRDTGKLIGVIWQFPDGHAAAKVSPEFVRLAS